MKKLILLFLAATTLSCSSDDGGTKNTKPEGYPEEVNNVNFTGKKVGDEIVLTGKGFDENKLGEYKITFVKKLPEKKTATTIATRAPKPEESNETVEAFILKVEPTKILFTIPADAGNGGVKFTYKRYDTPIGNYQR